jgi:hypothetical protein
MHIKRIQAALIAGLLLLMLVLPQLALAAGPEISNVVVLDYTSTTATIFWTTNTTGDSVVRYGTTTPPSQVESDSSDVTTHFIYLTGLTPNTKYYFEVKSTDVSGTSTDNNGGAYYSFTTLPITGYSITLDPVCGVCGELVEVEVCGEVIEATVTVAAAGTYHVCWDSRTAANVKGTFSTTMAGSRTLVFYMPEAKEGIHNVYLTTDTYAELAKTTFEVFPFVTIDPEEGPVGTEVTVNGYGFAASRDIRVSFQDTVKTDKADTVGSWEVLHTIPATPAGGYTFNIEAKEGTVWVSSGGKHFTVTPEITANPESGTVGQTIEISGTGFASEEEDIEVTFDGEVVKTTPNLIDADENGSWSAVIAVPALRSDRYIIDSSGESTRARDVPDVEFILGAGVSVEPSLAYVDDTITVTGGGFAPGETGIKVTFDGQVVAADITADIDGVWGASFVLPASSYGSHTVSASGDITKPAVETTLDTKAKIEELSPVEGAPGDPVSLTGSGFSNNKKLTVTVGGVAVPGNMQTRTNGNVAISFRVPASTVGKQTLKVTDEGGATDSVDFTVTKNVLPTPLRTLPADESKLRSGRVTFQWQAITSDNDVTYTLEISESADFDRGITSRSGIEELSYQLTEEEALPKDTYYWRVKAVDSYGNESEFSDSDYSTFTLSPIPTWVWIVVGVVVLVGLMVVAYRETKFKVTE